MAYFITENCSGCTACVSRCPTSAITGVRKSLHSVSAALCIECGACGVVCPSEAIFDGAGAGAILLKKSQRPRAFVDAQSCTGCEKCVERCPFECLSVADAPGAHFGVVQVAEAKCTGCRECAQACPYDAIFVHRRDQVPAELRPAVAA
ncbi:MAG: 4Fe-4S binding protein [Anaeromyxobacteraceae bacterium]